MSKWLANNMPLFSALAYGVISIAITLNNKAVLSTYKYKSTMTLTLLQGLVTVICLRVMKARGLIDLPAFSWQTAKKVAPLSFLFIAYVVISLISLGRVNVPMFTALRRVTIVFVMIEEFYLLGIIPSGKVLQSVAVMCVGAIIAAYRDLSFDMVSYFFLFLTNIFTSLYTVYIAVVKKETNLNIWAMLYYNNVLTMPFLFVLAWYTGDLKAAWKYKHYGDLWFQVNFQASIFLAFLLNVATFYCTTLNSARTQTVVGQLKNFFAFLLGLVLFNDYIYDHLNFVGLIIGFAGGVMYSYVTYAEKQEKDRAKAAQAALQAPAAGSSGSASTVIEIAGGSTDRGKPDGVEQTEEGEVATVSGVGGHNLTRRGGGGGAILANNDSGNAEEDGFGLDHEKGLLHGQRRS